MNPRLATRRVWAIVPAAGRGTRFAGTSAGVSAPKQYAPLLGSTVLQFSLRALLAEPRVHAVVVALAAGDDRWPGIASMLDSPKVKTTLGGATRQESVMNGLEYLALQAAPDDWVLVHDAARPCFSSAELREPARGARSRGKPCRRDSCRADRRHGQARSRRPRCDRGQTGLVAGVDAADLCLRAVAACSEGGNARRRRRYRRGAGHRKNGLASRFSCPARPSTSRSPAQRICASQREY